RSISSTVCPFRDATLGGLELHHETAWEAFGHRLPAHLRVPSSSCTAPGVGSSVSDVLGWRCRLGAPGPVIARPDAAVAIAVHTLQPAFPDHARAGYPA